MELNIPIPENDIVVAVDSIDMKVPNRGDWMREKHGIERRSCIKIHIAVDVETRKPVTFEITNENTTDREMAKSVLEKLNKRIL